MKLTNTGTIKSDDYNVLRTQDDRWMVSRSGTIIGYCDSLAEVEPMVQRYRQAVRDRLAKVEAEAAARYTEQRMREAENRQPVEDR